MSAAKVKCLFLSAIFMVIIFFANLSRSELLFYLGMFLLILIFLWLAWQIGIKQSDDLLTVDFGVAWRKSVIGILLISAISIALLTIFLYLSHSNIY